MGDRIRVLHVDDDPNFAEMTATFLREENERLTATVETRAADALGRLRDRADIDCVISDYALPEMDGLELLDAVRAEYPDLPFILYTGKGSESVASDALARGATDYLQKQGGTEQYELLGNRVRNAVEQYRDERERERIERARRDLHRVASNTALSVGEKVERVLEIGCEGLDVENGHVARIDRDEGRHEVTRAAGSDVVCVDTVSELGRTYCRRTVEAAEPLAVYNAAEEGWGDDPAHEQWDVSCYIGGRIEVGGDLHGTACFVDRTPRVRPFTEGERAFVDLATRWLSHMFERRERERELERYEAVARTVSDVIVVVDEDGRIDSVNPAIEDVLGYEPESVVGEPVTTLIPSQLEADHRAAFERYLGTGERRLDWEYTEFPGCHREGHEVPLAVSFSEFDHEGRRFFAGVLREVA